MTHLSITCSVLITNVYRSKGNKAVYLVKSQGTSTYPNTDDRSICTYLSGHSDGVTPLLSAPILRDQRKDGTVGCLMSTVYETVHIDCVLIGVR